MTLAFVVHDLEEVLAADWWHRSGPDVLRARLPLTDRQVEIATATTTPQMAVATSVVGCGVAAVAWSAVRGHERPVRAASAVFTAHGIGHLASATLLRSYTPGSVSAAAVVLPWGAWAMRRLGPAGPGTRGRVVADRALTGVGVLALAVAGHVLGRRVGPGGAVSP